MEMMNVMFMFHEIHQNLQQQKINKADKTQGQIVNKIKFYVK